MAKRVSRFLLTWSTLQGGKKTKEKASADVEAATVTPAVG